MKHCLGKGSDPNRLFLHISDPTIQGGASCTLPFPLPTAVYSSLDPLLPPVNSLGTTTNKILSGHLFSVSHEKSLEPLFGSILTQRKIISCLISYLIS